MISEKEPKRLLVCPNRRRSGPRSVERPWLPHLAGYIGLSPLLSLMSTVACASSSKAMSSRLPPKAAWWRAENLAWGTQNRGCQ